MRAPKKAKLVARKTICPKEDAAAAVSARVQLDNSAAKAAAKLNAKDISKAVNADLKLLRRFSFSS